MPWEGVPKGGGNDGEGPVSSGPVFSLDGGNKRLASADLKERVGAWWWRSPVR